jgi:hypothetical protein
MADAEDKGPAADIEEAVEKGGKVSPLLWKICVGLLVALLSWMGGYVSKAYDKFQESNAAMEKRLQDLEQDKAKWATLASLEQKQMEMQIQLEIMRQVWSWEYNRKVPTSFPERSGEPVLKAPAELFRDVDRYKMIQQQKMPPSLPPPPSPSKN